MPLSDYISELIEGDIVMTLHRVETTSAFWPADMRAGDPRRKVRSRAAVNSGRPRIMGQVLRVLSLWRARAQARAANRRILAELSALDEHLLNDIGINWRYLRWQASKPFWRA
jgi:uncharacterized protein YjiS (DUF1127 family)